MILLRKGLRQYRYRFRQPLFWEHPRKLAILILVHFVLDLLQHRFLACLCSRVDSLCLDIFLECLFVRDDEHNGVRVLVVVQDYLLDVFATIGETILIALWTIFLAIGTNK